MAAFTAAKWPRSHDLGVLGRFTRDPVSTRSRICLPRGPSCCRLRCRPMPSALSSYIDRVRVKSRRLSPSEEKRLARRLRTSGDRAAARALVTAHLPLVVRIARDFRHLDPNLLGGQVDEDSDPAVALMALAIQDAAAPAPDVLVVEQREELRTWASAPSACGRSSAS
jgi:hypothetical protein